MADIVDSSPSPVFAIDRVLFASRGALVEVIKYHLTNGAIVQIEDSYSRPRSLRLCYEVRPGKAAFYTFGAHGRQIGVFADVAALVDHAEAVTGV